MKKWFVAVVGIAFALGFFACRPNRGNKIDAEVYSKFQQAGDKISNVAQGVLLANVGKAMQHGGPKNAVSFCNLNASSIVDSLNHVNNCMISRVSAKNRNPENVLQNNTDRQLWDYFSDQISGTFPKDTLIASKGEIIYYKSIKIGLPACLKCHGVPGQDINNETFTELQKLYPNDLATGYQLNDFRGLWKIRFQKTLN
jgi:cytochrome c553